MSFGLVLCDECRHRRGLHKAGGQCRMAMCDCLAFVGQTPIDAPVEEETPTGNLVQIIVPDGFAVTVTLTPISKEDSSDG